MGKLSEEEQSALDQLLAKRDAPDEDKPGTNRVINMHVDLGDKEQVKLAHKLGFLDLGEEESEEESTEEESGEEEPAPKPKRSGYF